MSMAEGQAMRIDKPDKEPAYSAIATQLQAEIAAGIYAPGTALPTQRDLANQLGVNVSTILRAYQELQARGLVTGRKRLGTIVAPLSFAPTDATEAVAELADLTYNSPPVSDFIRAYALELDRIDGDSRFKEVQNYSSASGSFWARAAGCQWIAEGGLITTPERVVVTSGAQHALFSALATFIKPGDVILTDRLTYFGLRALAATLQFSLVCVDSDEDGILPNSIEAICRSQRVTGLFVVPTLHNPTAKTLDAERRQQIATLARTFDFIVVEDDVYSLLADNGLKPISALCPERAFYITTTSKALAPSLCLGYLVAPAEHVGVAAESARLTGSMATPVSALVMTRWVEDGTARKLLDANRREINLRQMMVDEVFNGLDYRSAPYSMFLWLRLPEPWRAIDFAAGCRRRGVKLLPSPDFAADNKEIEQGVRINISGTIGIDRLRQALETLRQLCEDRPRAVHGTV
ncbi:DNA-binding transcriptional MocR family regulator [Mycoplana sp. BE70]|uniref:aminotransferase-like domain-containing protein n=1 Tax=Mycoplana sp. BE70 TaxID=2817775 RepID=UPI0028547D82|nr:PLP-dependent aminotransferase family protein [Mycoplana sp. BE70]MDR6759399.1 DNA-binding transcriptional MocR family regulator [Mycoplana sp. BE70]